MARKVGRVAVLALDGVIPFELGIPARIFGAAVTRDEQPIYEVLTCSLDGAPVTTSAGFDVAVRHDASVLLTADLVILPPSFAHRAVIRGEPLPADLLETLRSIPPTTRIASICTASYVLAAAGMLDGRPATTHWRESETFQRLFPAVRVDADVLFVDDGRVLTSAGAAAGVDLCLHLVRQERGSEVANRVARRCVVPPWREGGQAQYIERPVPQPTMATTAATRAWALEQLHRPLTLNELARHAGTSVRTFTRRFRSETAITPGAWLTAQRIALACHLLESSDLSIDQVADRAGFGTAASLRYHLRTSHGVGPAAYRRTFRADPDDPLRLPASA